MKVEKLSPSDINSIKYCPFQWLNRKNGVIGIVADDRALMFGKSVHMFIQSFYNRISDKPEPSEIDMVARKAFKEIVESSGLPFGYKQKADTILKNFIDFEIKRVRTWAVYKPIFVEKKLKATIREDLPILVGIVDFYGNENGIDWKSGLGGLLEDRMVQGKSYEIILTQNGYPTKKFTFVGLPTNQYLETPKVSDGWFIREMERIVDILDKNKFTKNFGRHCGYCEYILKCSLSSEDFWDGQFYEES